MQAFSWTFYATRYLWLKATVEGRQNITNSILLGNIRDSIMYQLTFCRRCGNADGDGYLPNETVTAN